MIRTVASLTAAAVLYMFTITLAQEPAPPSSPTQASASETIMPTSTPAVEGEKRGDKHEMNEEHDGKGKEKGKGKGKGHGHSKKRGLERADEAAGEHGKQGRDKVRGHGKHKDRENHGKKDKHEEGEQNENEKN